MPEPDTSGPDCSEFVTTRDGARLYTETFHPPNSRANEARTAQRAVLMIMGGNAPCFAFPDALCRMIATAGHRVVRYDHRGAGHSSPVNFPEDSYPLTTLASDAAEVIEGLGLAQPLVYGISTGGATAQLLALNHPERVGGLVLMATSPDYNVDPVKPPETGLPSPGDDWVSLVQDMAANPPGSHETAVDAYVHGWRVCIGPDMPFDEPYWRSLVEGTLALPDNPAPGVHQGPAVDAAPPRTGRLSSVHVPTLVIHGGNDVVLPPAHGRALAEAIPDAQLCDIPELGHMFPPEFSERLAALITERLPTGD